MKYRTIFASPQTSIEQPSTSNNLVESSSNLSSRRRQHTLSDNNTDVSLFTSKSDSYPLNVNDETVQTETNDMIEDAHVNFACTDAERQQQQQSALLHDDESTDLLLVGKRCSTIGNRHSTAAMKPLSSNLAIATENPWKKLSNVRYKLDESVHNESDQRQSHYICAEHITFV
jgi:hypothetical protein